MGDTADEVAAHDTPGYAPGAVIGRYRIERLLGRGGSADVYAAVDTVVGLRVAIKVLSAATASRDDALRRFSRELVAASSVAHPNLVRVYDVTELPDGRVALVEEMLDGGSLESHLAAHGPLDLAALRRWIMPVLDAVSAAHARGVAHGDIKPSNIMLRTGAGGGEGVLVDLGLSRFFADHADAAGHTLRLGTPMFMAPEHITHNRVDARSDQYMLGLVAVTCLTGRPPFEASSVNELIMQRATRDHPMPPEVTAMPAVAAVLSRATQREPDARYASVAELRAALDAALDAPLVHSAPSEPARPPAPNLESLRHTTAHAASAPAHAPATVPEALGPTWWSTHTGGVWNPLATLREPPPPASPWAALRDALPPGFDARAQDIETFLRGAFAGATPQSEFVVELHGEHLAALGIDWFYAIFLPFGAGASGEAVNLASTMAFVHRAATLTEHLASLRPDQRKVVLAFFDADELGRGIRTKILEFRNRHAALVIPVSLSEVARRADAGEVRRLLEERLREFHHRPDLFSAPEHADAPLSFRGLKPTLRELASHFDQGASLVAVCGPPGVGKHSLLQNFQRYADEWTLLQVDALEPAERTVASAAGLVLRALGDAPPAAVDAAWQGPLRAALDVARPNTLLVIRRADWLVQALIKPGVSADERAAARAFWTLVANAVSRGRVGVVVVASFGYLLGERCLLDWDNPAASVTKTLLLRGLTEPDIDAMVRGLGAQIDMHFDDEAVAAVWRASAGIPCFARWICSEVLRRHAPDGASMPSWRPLTVSASMVEAAVTSLAQDPGAFRSLRAGFAEGDLRVFARIAARDGAALRTLRAEVPGEDPSQVVQRLQAIGMVRLDARSRYVCAVPVMARWAAAHLDAGSGSSQRPVVAVALGLTVSALGLAAYLWRVESHPVTRALAAPWDGCHYQATYPPRVAEGATVTIHLARRCDGAPPSRPALELVPDEDTRMMAGAEERSTLPFTWAAGSEDLRASAKVTLDGSGPYRLAVRDVAARRAVPVRLDVDAVATLLATVRAWGVKAVLLPATLGAVVTYFRDLMGALRALAGFFTRRTDEPGAPRA